MKLIEDIRSMALIALNEKPDALKGETGDSILQETAGEIAVMIRQAFPDEKFGPDVPFTHEGHVFVYWAEKPRGGYRSDMQGDFTTAVRKLIEWLQTTEAAAV